MGRGALTRLALLALGFILTLLLLAYVLYPQTRVWVLGLPALSRVFSSWANWEALWGSLALSLLTVAGSLLLGALLAWGVAVLQAPGHRWVSVLASLPLALPPFVGVVALYLLVGEGGWLGGYLRGTSAVWLVHVYALHAYAYLFTRARLEQADASWWEAAALLGAGPVRRFLRITAPVLWPAWRRAALLVFLLSMSSFTAPLLFAPDQRFLTTQVYYYKLNGDLSAASALSVVLALVGLCVFLLLERFALSSRAASKGSPRPLRYRPRKGIRMLWAVFFGAYAFFVLAPLFVLAALSCIENPAQWLAGLSPRWTLEHYRRLFAEPETLRPLWSSFEMAGLSVAAVVPLGLGVAYLARRLRAGRLLLGLALLPYALPGTVVGINLLAAFSAPSPLALGGVLVGTFWILPLTYCVRTLPLGVQAAASGLEALDERLLEAARLLGARGSYLARRLVVPLLAPALLGGALLIFMQAATEFVASVLLYTHANRPVSVEIFSYLRLFDLGAAAAYSVLLVLVLGLLSLLFRQPSRWMGGWG
ncbi:MAG: ABC transporter permease subunit [Bacteroidetes bacterium]|nr:ABC transporter permease subunit [Bacteroidota bacterium]